MGVVTTVELIRYFIDHPPRHTIIFLLNNFEEGGLIGAQAFTEHAWYPSVKLFINLGKIYTFLAQRQVQLLIQYCMTNRGCWCWWKSHHV